LENELASKKEHSLIVGGSRGLGREISFVIKEKFGGTISILCRNGDAEIFGHDSYCHLEADLCEPSRVVKVIKESIKENGKLNRVIFCQKYRGGNDWTGHLNVGCESVYRILEELKTDGLAINASVVMVGSTASHFVFSEQPIAYHVAKAGLEVMMKCYALELGANGVRVNMVCPGTFIKNESKSFYEKELALKKLYEKLNPLGRMGQSQEIANVVGFLCSDEASFLTGQNLWLDGGVSLRAAEPLAREISDMKGIIVTRKEENDR
jgi:NAD(P)-dependent dehydrogenase (short-subunit alcohol dehydrogenase family)